VRVGSTVIKPNTPGRQGKGYGMVLLILPASDTSPNRARGPKSCKAGTTLLLQAAGCCASYALYKILWMPCDIGQSLSCAYVGHCADCRAHSDCFAVLSRLHTLGRARVVPCVLSCHKCVHRRHKANSISGYSVRCCRMAPLGHCSLHSICQCWCVTLVGTLKGVP
jgi:hypothetical protein